MATRLTCHSPGSGSGSGSGSGGGGGGAGCGCGGGGGGSGDSGGGGGNVSPPLLSGLLRTRTSHPSADSLAVASDACCACSWLPAPGTPASIVGRLPNCTGLTNGII